MLRQSFHFPLTETQLLCRLELTQSFLEGGMEGLKQRCLAAEHAAVNQAHILQQRLTAADEQARASHQALDPDVLQVPKRPS
jgi:hypothetical protein